MPLDDDASYRALAARDARFDGAFFVGVTTTGIYCRPICTARTPRRDRCRFFRHPAEAEREGFRACFLCRPELAPGAAPIDATTRLSAVASARIEAGALDEGSLEALADELGVSGRHLRRTLQRELGVSPVELAQTTRLALAKQLLQDTRLPIAEVAFASGFSSIRRFNALFRERFGRAPSEVRRAEGVGDAGDAFVVTRGYRDPFAWDEALRFLAARATEGVERVEGGAYLRTARVGERRGFLRVRHLPERRAVRVEVSAALAPALLPIAARIRHLFDLDADPRPIAAHLGADPALSARLRAAPGLRVPGAFDGFEIAVRAILGQQITVKAATTLAGRLARAFGDPVETAHPGLDRVSPTPERLAEASAAELATIGLPHARAETLRALARAVVDRAVVLEPGAEVAATVQALERLPGVGAWTASYVAMRALRAPDAFPVGDLGLRRALGGVSGRALAARAEGWRPWRAYAAMHLWTIESGG